MARQAGKTGAAAKLEKMRVADPDRTGLLGLCGGSFIKLRFDGRTTFGRELVVASKTSELFRIYSCQNGWAEIVILGMHRRQEREVCVAASEAALEVLERELNVAGFVASYCD